MPDSDGYETWPAEDPIWSHPIDEWINVREQETDSARVISRGMLPKAIPFDKTIADRRIGLVNSWQYVFDLKAERTATGLKLGFVCTAKHLFWWEDHNETGVGPVQQFSFPADKTTRIFMSSPHTDHFDVTELSYDVGIIGDFDVQFRSIHSAEKLESMPPLHKPPIPSPEPEPSPTPSPESGPTPLPEPVPTPTPSPGPHPDDPDGP